MVVTKLNEVVKYISEVKWQFAKTYAKEAPHEYTVKEWAPEKGKKFEFCVKFIRENGYKAKFYDKEYIYYNIGEWKYWTMGEPVKKTTLINRAKLHS